LTLDTVTHSRVKDYLPHEVVDHEVKYVRSEYTRGVSETTGAY